MNKKTTITSKLKCLKPFLFTLIAITAYFNTSAQLKAYRRVPYNSINYLVRNILLGPGVSASNITYKWADTAIGFFNGTASNLGLDSGIVLTTGTISYCHGPNTSNSKSYQSPQCHLHTDSDLVVLAGGAVNDAAILEFDFVPTSDTVKFQYVFGSEEYPEFVNSFNDAFGFFLSGPGISGPFTRNAENIALIPFTSTPVTINNVNCNVNSAYYVCNCPTNGCAVGCPTSSSMSSTTVQYDGFTVPLTAIGVVQCGKKYHIKIAIADALDCAYDSGVFLKSGSFTSNGSSVSDAISYQNNVIPGDTILFRGNCGQASVFFEKAPGNINADTIIIDTAGTATPGIDYTAIPDTLIIPANKSGDTLNIKGLIGGSGIKTLILNVIQKICNTIDTQTIEIYIGNPPPILATQPPIRVCYNTGTTISPTVSGGVPGYTYNWSNGATTSSITVNNLTADTTFIVHLTDVCSDTLWDTVHVKVLTSSPVNIVTRDTIVTCPNNTVTIGANVSGGNPAYQYSWSVGGTTSSITVSPNATTKYKVTVTDSCGHVMTDSITVTVNSIPLVLTFRDTTIRCAGTVNLSVSATGGGGGYTYNWNNGSTTSGISVTATKDTSYIVTVTSPCGNQTQKDTVHVTVLPPNFAVTLAGDTAICNGQSTTLTVTGGGTYHWSTNSTSGSINIAPTSNTTYTLAITNGNCVLDTSITVRVKNPAAITLNPNPAKICEGDSVTLLATGGGSYKWSNGATTSSILVSPSSTKNYTVVVSNGCPDSASTQVIVTPVNLNACCDTSILKGGSAQLITTGGTSYIWTPTTALSCNSCPDPIASPTVTTTYTVIMTDSNGCIVQRVLTVNVEIPCADFEVANIFTPNNDGINDDFVVKVLDASSYSINVFDRWGKEVYSSTDVNVYWNGRINGTDNLVPNGVYYYIVKATCGTNNYVKKGFVEVLGGK